LANTCKPNIFTSPFRIITKNLNKKRYSLNKKEELRKLTNGNYDRKIDKNTTKEEFIINFRNEYRRNREQEQHDKGYYG